MPRPLPVPLERDGTVKGAVVVVHGGHGVPETPHAKQGLEKRPAEGEEVGVGPTGPAGGIVERDLPDPPALGVHTDQDLLQDIEVPRDGTRFCRISRRYIR